MNGRLMALGWAALGAACALAAVKEEVKVSDFGWDAADATCYVQAAFDSGARRVVFDRQAGPWIVTPVKARSHTDIVFEDGVELVAKRGEFHGLRDCLLDFAGVTNVSLVGLGAKGGTLRMHKADYQTDAYRPSEWRYALAIRGAVNVRVENMSFISSGGDGICIGGMKDGLGYSRDVAIHRCVCDDNHRQGISVVSAENLLIEDTVLKNTRGTPPQSGIDFEPDHSGHRMANCTVRRCVIEGNEACGVLICLVQQDERSVPIGITVADTVVRGNGYGAQVTVGGKNRYASPPTGAIGFTNCVFSSGREGFLTVYGKPAGFPLVFVDCTASNEVAGVKIFSGGWGDFVPDGIAFRNLVMHCPEGRDWFSPTPDRRGLNPAVPTDITGDVTLVRPDGRREKVTLDATWSRARFALEDAAEMPPVRVKWPNARKAVLRDTAPGRMVKLVQPVSAVALSRYIVFSEKAGEAHFRIRQIPSKAGAKHLSEGEIMVKSWRFGKAFHRIPPPGVTPETVTVAFPGRGFHFFDSWATRFVIDEADVPVALDVESSVNLRPPADGNCSFFLFVPQGTERFAVLANGGMGVELFAPDGKPSGSRGPGVDWIAVQPKSPAAGLWRVDFRPPVAAPKSFRLDLTGVPGLLWLSKEKTVSFSPEAEKRK